MMRFPWVLCATVILWDKAGAAPRGSGGQITAHVVQSRPFPPDLNPHSVFGRSKTRVHLNVTNTTAPVGTTGVVSGTPLLPLNLTSTYRPSSLCPLSVITSTTTLDVTFYITATTSYGNNATSTGPHVPPTTSFSRTNNGSITSRGAWNCSTSSVCFSTKSSGSAGSSISSMISSTTVTEPPCEEANPSNSTTISPSTIVDTTSTKSDEASTSVSRDPTLCDTTASTFTFATDTSPTPNVTSSPISTETLITTGSWNDDASTTLSPVISSAASWSRPATTISSEAANPTSPRSPATSPVATQALTDSISSSSTQTSSVNLSYTSDIVGTPSTPATYTPTRMASCVIDTSMVPVTSAPLVPVPSPTLVPTKTVCQNDAPTGKPKPGNHHCGVHGLPVGSYFLARFVENSPATSVTLEGCYQFCASVMNATNGCKSYRFYPERGLNVPRCDLYGSPVAYALDSINNDHPDMWFDLSCESPSDQKWTHLPGMKRLRDLGLLL